MIWLYGLMKLITYSGRAKRGIGSMTKMQKTILTALSQESRQR